MTEIIDLNTKRKQSQQSSQNTSIDTMLMLLEKYHNMLRQMKDSGVDHMDVTVGDSTLEFVPKSLCVIVGDGSVVLSEGLHGLNSIEALGLQSKLKEIVFENT